MLRNKYLNYSNYINYLFKNNCILLKAIHSSSRIIFGNLCRIRNLEIERYVVQKFKHKFNENKSKYTSNIGRFFIGATVLSFAEDKISDDEIQNHFQEFYIEKPEKIPVPKPEEKKVQSFKKVHKNAFGDSRYLNRLKLMKNIASVNKFSEITNSHLSPEKPEVFIDDSWCKLIDSKSVKLWRKPLESNPNVFEYRLCGTFDNISAHSFYNVQTDIEYRKKWDDLIVDLRVLHHDNETNTDIIRWVTQYPYPMKDREYIYKRRACHLQDNKSAIIVSKAVNGKVIDNDSRSAVKIVDYKSIMYIQAHKSFNEMGMDYFLIYYDDPRTNFPSTAVSWMSTAGIPSYMEKVHKASLLLERNIVKIVPEKLLDHTLINDNDSQNDTDNSRSEELYVKKIFKKILAL